MNPPTAPLPALTGVRAYAAAWVMLMHLQYFVGVDLRLGPFVARGAWGVDVFFVLSGLILTLLYADRFQGAGLAAHYRNYLAARFARIYPLHAATLAVLCLFFLVHAAARDDWTAPAGSDGYHLLLNLALIHAWELADGLNWNYPSWSISCEWFAYLFLLPLLARGLARWSWASCLVLAGALWLALFGVLHARGEMIAHQAVHWGIPRIAAEFTLGYALARVLRRFDWPARAGDALALAGLAALAAICLLPRWGEALLMPAVALLLLGLARPGPLARALFANRHAVFWGERSYSVYMLHAVVQVLGGTLISHWNPLSGVPGGRWILLGLYAGAILLLSHAAYLALEMPLRDRVRRALSRRAVPADLAVAT